MVPRKSTIQSREYLAVIPTGKSLNLYCMLCFAPSSFPSAWRRITWRKHFAWVRWLQLDELPIYSVVTGHVWTQRINWLSRARIAWFSLRSIVENKDLKKKLRKQNNLSLLKIVETKETPCNMESQNMWFDHHQNNCWMFKMKTTLPC